MRTPQTVSVLPYLFFPVPIAAETGTVVTSFPRVWQRGVPQRMTSDPPHQPTAPSDPLDVFDQIFEFLGKKPTELRSYKGVTDLCCLLIDRCAGNIIDAKLTQDLDRQYIEFYNRYIDELMDQQKLCLEKLDEQLNWEKSSHHATLRASALTSERNVSGPVDNRANTSGIALATERETSAPESPREDANSLDITHEFKILKNVRDIIEELGMISHIVKQQREAVDSIDHEYRHQESGDSPRSLPLPGFNGNVSQPGQTRRRGHTSHTVSEDYGGRRRGSAVSMLESPLDLRSPAQQSSGRATNLPPRLPGDRSPSQQNNFPPAGISAEPASESQEQQMHNTQQSHHGGNPVEGVQGRLQKLTQGAIQSREVPKVFLKLGERVAERELILHGLREKARAAEKSILHLLDLKQRQANVLESRMSRRIAQASEKQSEAVMLFTIITIVFLPMSTLASMFGMNAREFGQGETPIGHIWTVLFGVSVPLTVSILYLAFHRRVRRILTLIPEYLWRRVTHWFCFDWLMAWEDRLEAAIEHYRRRNQEKQEPKRRKIMKHRRDRENRKKARPTAWTPSATSARANGSNQSNEGNIRGASTLTGTSASLPSRNAKAPAAPTTPDPSSRRHGPVIPQINATPPQPHNANVVGVGPGRDRHTPNVDTRRSEAFHGINDIQPPNTGVNETPTPTSVPVTSTSRPRASLPLHPVGTSPEPRRGDRSNTTRSDTTRTQHPDLMKLQTLVTAQPMTQSRTAAPQEQSGDLIGTAETVVTSQAKPQLIASGMDEQNLRGSRIERNLPNTGPGISDAIAQQPSDCGPRDVVISSDVRKESTTSTTSGVNQRKRGTSRLMVHRVLVALARGSQPQQDSKDSSVV
jgi:hypothetical protein